MNRVFKCYFGVFRDTNNVTYPNHTRHNVAAHIVIGEQREGDYIRPSQIHINKYNFNKL